MNTSYVPKVNKFENDISTFIKDIDDIFDIDNDPDLANYYNMAKQQLEHIKQLRQQIGI